MQRLKGQENVRVGINCDEKWRPDSIPGPCGDEVVSPLDSQPMLTEKRRDPIDRKMHTSAESFSRNYMKEQL
jgi:hypothetical protein